MRMPRRVLPPVFAALLVPWLAVATPAEGPDNGGAGSPPAPVADGGPVEIDVAPDRLPLDEIRRYVSVYRTVQQAYIEDVEDRALMQAAIRGLLSDLDPHSAYLDHEEALSMTEQATGAYDGIGVELVQQPDRSLLVVAAIDGTPAARAGLRNGDVITAIDGQPVNVDHVDGAIRTLRGAPGTRVELLVLRPGEAGPIAVTVVRERIRITSVRSRMLEPGFGYLRISLFQAETATDVARALDAMAAEGGGPIAGLVLDLRSNPGGLLNAAVEVADLFLDGGVIVSTRGRLPFANSRFSASPGDRLEGTPIVALIQKDIRR